MILWTVMPLSVVFDQQEKSVSPYEIEYAGTKIQVKRLSEDQLEVIRILSTDPQDYLREDIQPGTVLLSAPVYKTLA